MRWNTRVFEASVPVLAAIRAFVLESTTAASLPEREAQGIVLAVDEACSNVIQHGYQGVEGDIEICIGVDPQRFEVQISDGAAPFNPLNSKKESAIKQPLEARAPGGLGLLMMEQNTSAIRYEPRVGGGNVLTLVIETTQETADER